MNISRQSMGVGLRRLARSPPGSESILGCKLPRLERQQSLRRNTAEKFLEPLLRAAGVGIVYDARYVTPSPFAEFRVLQAEVSFCQLAT